MTVEMDSFLVERCGGSNHSIQSSRGLEVQIIAPARMPLLMHWHSRQLGDSS
jgi:hypothetical protein